MSAQVPYKFEPRTSALSRDDVNQINKILAQIKKDIQTAGSGTPTAAKTSPAPVVPTPPGAVNTGVAGAVSVTEVNSKGGTTPGAPASVITDGSTIVGDGSSANPVELGLAPLANGGTGIDQAETQQITTNGTLIGPGTAQAQPPLTLAGVLTTSAVAWSLPNTPDPTWQTGIFAIFVCTANTVTMYLVNPTAAGITPVAQAVNIKVIL